ncbi:hypothetical protein DEO72_LG6g1221 [Vigna unguiculata]|uniref:Uncharacterized protein n=2 Tax=Vigna unguiculata TaxID=3917 RepID=A0A4D6M6L5_VIGUN|nr:hypothetical protein DEO72_LG6g1221 [Vigna unguiculata]
MGVEELSAGDKEVVGMLLKFVDKLPTKGLVRIYNSVHPIIDIEGHMAQSGKKNLALFQSLRKEMAAKAKVAGKADVPNLREVKEVGELQGKVDKLEEEKATMRTMVEFGSKALVLSRRVGWTNNPSRYKDMGVEELSAGDKEVVGMLLKFVDKLPTKGLVRVYNSVHPIIDIEGHMAQSGKKNLALFQSLRKEMAAKAKAAGKVDVPNLQESVVEVHVHGGTKRKAELPPRPGKGKDVKKIRATILGSASGAGSASGEKLPEARLIELPEISSLEARP